ncbi:tetratricopeptide repeat protein [Undibacterium sp.]|uniref:tetratricopeptide repeat protein n=1 Tax=Undibacterium sp. TaxID=1914977 RepID=UPI00374D1538
MKQFRLSRLAVLLAVIGLSTVPELTGFVGNTAYAQEALRPEVGKNVQAAGEMFKAKKYKEALAKLRETDNISGKNANENFTIERMRAAVASAAGDNDAAIRAYEAVLATNKLSGPDHLTYLKALAGAYYKAGNYAKTVQTITRFNADGGSDPAMRPFLIQSLYMSGDYGRTLKEVQSDIASDEKSGRTPSETSLQLYANAALKQNDKAGYVGALEKLLNYYPKKELWADMLNRLPGKPGFSERLSLDLYRLKLAVGQLTKTNDFMEMSQLSLQAGYPTEAIKVIDQGYKSNALGTGTEAERHKRLRDLANKNLAESNKGLAAAETDAEQSKDGSGLVNLGYLYVVNGQADKGLAMMEKGIAKDNIKYPEDAKLHLGIAYLQAGKKANAIKTFKSVQGKDGAADLARYWIIYANQK